MPDSSAARSTTRNRLHLPRSAADRAVAIASAGVPLVGRFPTPADLADEARICVVTIALPAPHTEITDGYTIWAAPHGDQREFGSRVFRALASAIIGPSTRSPSQVCALAAWLALPPDLVAMAGGLEAAIEEQTWATESLLRCWGSSL